MERTVTQATTAWERVKEAAAWIADRLREDSTRSALGQIALIILLLAVLFGVDIGALLSQTEGFMARLAALAAGAAAISVQVARVVTPEPRAIAGELVVGLGPPNGAAPVQPLTEAASAQTVTGQTP